MISWSNIILIVSNMHGAIIIVNLSQPSSSHNQIYIWSTPHNFSITDIDPPSFIDILNSENGNKDIKLSYIDIYHLVTFAFSSNENRFIIYFPGTKWYWGKGNDYYCKFNWPRPYWQKKVRLNRKRLSEVRSKDMKNQVIAKQIWI